MVTMILDYFSETSVTIVLHSNEREESQSEEKAGAKIREIQIHDTKEGRNFRETGGDIYAGGESHGMLMMSKYDYQ